MRSIERNVGKEWLLFQGALGNKSIPLFKKYVGTKTFGRNNFAIVKIATIEIGVIPYVRRLSDSTTAMAISFVSRSCSCSLLE